MICRVCVVAIFLMLTQGAMAQVDDKSVAQVPEPKPSSAQKVEKKIKNKKNPEKNIPTEVVSDQKKDEDKLMYPELEVTPRASQRIEIEAKKEKQDRWTMHLPLQLSALATIYFTASLNEDTGLDADEKDKYDTGVSYAAAVGYGWLLGTFGMSALYRPYKSGFNEINRYKGGSMRADLTKERLAEEALKRPAEVGKKLLWFSMASHLYVNLSLVPYVDHDSKINLGMGAAAALIPLLFENHWFEVYEKHREYKKKIYGPVTSVVPYQREGQVTPLYQLTWSY